MRSYCFAALLFLTNVPFLKAAVPASFTYQGSLKQNGTPLNGTAAIEIKITNSSGTAVYWTSGAQNISVTEGLYRVELSPTNVDWSNITPYIETVVNGTTLLPREKLTSAVYAQVSQYAQTAQTLTAGATITGNISLASTFTAQGKVILTNGAVMTGGAFITPLGSPAQPVLANAVDPTTGLFFPWYGKSILFSIHGTTVAAVHESQVDLGTAPLMLRGSLGGWYPPTDNAVSLGAPGGYRFTSVWATNGTIQTSSSKQKREIRELVSTTSKFSMKPVMEGTIPKISPQLNRTSKLKAPRGIVFKWKNKEGKPDDQDVIGFMGDDLPDEAHAIREDGTRDPENFYTSAVIGILSAKINELEGRIALLEKRLGTSTMSR